MASGIFAVLDDIGALMDDVAVATKIASRKTAAILGDDLAVNAQKATGFVASRELPVLWAITKGSLLNKLIIVPVALLLNAFFPSVITFVLVLGGVYLSYEGAEKIVEYFFHPSTKTHKAKAINDDTDPKAEKAKIRSAITTDFILSVEIVIIALGSVSGKALMLQVMTVAVVAVLATIGVYGIVALIVRMDDAGYRLIASSPGKVFRSVLGNLLVKALPVIIKILGFVGTIALILVAGGIFIHNVEYLHTVLPNLPSIVRDFSAGLTAGLLAVLVIKGSGKIISLLRPKHSE